MKMKKYDEYARIADVNEHKNINDIFVGDFVWGCTGHGKDCGICDLLHSPGQPRLLKVVEVINVTTLPMDNWLGQPAPRNRGGSQSDDVPDDLPLWQHTSEQIGTFYQLVTMYRCGDKALYVDCQGYDYWRYVYLPTWYAAMYSEAVEVAQTYEVARNKVEELEKDLAEAKLAEREAELRACWYGVLKVNPANGKEVAANVKTYLSRWGVKAKVTARYNSYYWSYYVTITPAEPGQREQVKDLMERFTEALPTGDSNTYKTPSNIFGAIYDYVIK